MPDSVEVVINTYLAGVRRFIAGVKSEAVALAELGLSTKTLGHEMDHANKRTWLFNQTLFTARRLVYGVTLGVIAGGIAVLKWGNDFNEAMQGARVALRPFFHSSKELEHNLNELWKIARYSPFQIQDMTLAFSRLAPIFMSLGMTGADVTRTLKDLTDALSVSMAGRVTPAALNRASVALQHMGAVGRLTGMSVLQMARDGIPIYQALTKELGLTADQIHNIGKLGVPATVALMAIQRYVETNPGYAGAAQRLANKSVAGLLSQAKDNISRIMGAAEEGWFHSLQHMLVAANNFFTRLYTEMHKTHNLFTALDRIISPHTHAFIIGWRMIVNTVKDAITILKALLGTLYHSRSVWILLGAALATIHLSLAAIAHTTGIWVPLLRILIPLLIAYWVWTKAIAVANWSLTTSQYAVYYSQYSYAAFVKRVLIPAMGLYSVLTKGYIKNDMGRFASMTRLEKQAYKLRLAFIALAGGEIAGAAGIAIIVTAALLLIGTLVILYFKWKAFHDLVNGTVSYLYKHWYILALIPVIGPFLAAATLISRHWKTIAHWIREAVIWSHRFHGLKGPSGIDLVRRGKHLLGFQHGGTMPFAGPAMVGERGPEIVSLPAGARVTPLRPIAAAAGMGGQTIQVQLLVDGRVLAETVARHNTNVNARR